MYRSKLLRCAEERIKPFDISSVALYLVVPSWKQEVLDDPMKAERWQIRASNPKEGKTPTLVSRSIPMHNVLVVRSTF